MSDLETKLKTIQQKAQQLLKQQNMLQKQNQQLQKEIKDYQLQSGRQQQVIEGLKQQAEIAKISSGNWDQQDKKDFEKRINAYIREIDRCIALLSE